MSSLENCMGIIKRFSFLWKFGAAHVSSISGLFRTELRILWGLRSVTSWVEKLGGLNQVELRILGDLLRLNDQSQLELNSWGGSGWEAGGNHWSTTGWVEKLGGLRLRSWGLNGQIEKQGGLRLRSWGITGQPRVELKSWKGSGWEAGDLMVKLKSREGSGWEAGGSLVNQQFELKNWQGSGWEAGQSQVELKSWQGSGWEVELKNWQALAEKLGGKKSPLTATQFCNEPKFNPFCKTALNGRIRVSAVQIRCRAKNPKWW